MQVIYNKKKLADLIKKNKRMEGYWQREANGKFISQEEKERYKESRRGSGDENKEGREGKLRIDSPRES